MSEPKFEDSFNCSDTLEYRRGGLKITAKLVPDDFADPPWDMGDGHGPVTDWTNRPKSAGELVLCEDRGSRRYYDFAEACRLALKDKWGPPRPDETPKQTAARTAREDFDWLRRWCQGDWHYVGVVLDAERDGWTMENVASLWGIESENQGDYLTVVANELLPEALEQCCGEANQ